MSPICWHAIPFLIFMVYWLHFVKDPKRSMLHFSKSNSHTNAEVGEFFAKFKAENHYGTPLPSSKRHTYELYEFVACYNNEGYGKG